MGAYLFAWNIAIRLIMGRRKELAMFSSLIVPVIRNPIYDSESNLCHHLQLHATPALPFRRTKHSRMVLIFSHMNLIL